jgi:hypothetical protein
MGMLLIILSIETREDAGIHVSTADTPSWDENHVIWLMRSQIEGQSQILYRKRIMS